MLKIIKSSDPIRVERINLCIYGQPGVGKTSLAFTADSPLLLDFDQGAHRSANRKDSVTVHNWEDVTSISADDLEGYSTVCVDTAGRALDALTADIIRRNPKAGRGGALTLQGYGALKADFIGWLKLLNSFGKDVVLLAHMDEQRNGDDIIERLDVQGGSKGEIYKASDAMGRLAIRGGKHTLNFNPTDAAFGKNPGALDVLEVPHPVKDPQFLAGVVQSIKDKLNTLTEEQAETQKKLEAWRKAIEDLDTVDGFNDQLKAIRKEPKPVQVLFADAAKSRGYVFDKKAGAYTAQQAA
jgi:hypothetical protein